MRKMLLLLVRATKLTAGTPVAKVALWLGLAGGLGSLLGLELLPLELLLLLLLKPQRHLGLQHLLFLDLRTHFARQLQVTLLAQRLPVKA